MDDQTLIQFYEYAVQREKLDDVETHWDNHFVIALAAEIIRLKNEYEGFGYGLD